MLQIHSLLLTIPESRRKLNLNAGHRLAVCAVDDLPYFNSYNSVIGSLRKWQPLVVSPAYVEATHIHVIDHNQLFECFLFSGIQSLDPRACYVISGKVDNPNIVYLTTSILPAFIGIPANLRVIEHS